MGFFKSIFTWWEGATIGTSVALRGKDRMGEDSLGNVYWQGGSDANGLPRRWVIYNGPNDASRVPPEWFSWLHHQIDDVPDRALPPVRSWEKPPEANQTGTRLAYRPPGALEAGGRRVAATGDYEAWTPDA
jgi:NADH:ubiquinone oxidoreductase subunit